MIGDLCQVSGQLEVKEWTTLPMCWTLGRVLIIWDPSKFSCSNMDLGSFTVSIKLANGEGAFWLSSVYGSNNATLRMTSGWS